jgi:hypothetical protein
MSGRFVLKLLANGLEPKADEEGVKWNAEQLRRIDHWWHDLRHHAEPVIMPSLFTRPMHL